MAIHFHNKSKSYYLTTNYKVWYGTLIHQPELKILKKEEYIDIVKNFNLDKSDPNKIKSYHLVRNPYKKLESLYKHKFIHQPLNLKSFEDHPLYVTLFPFLALDIYDVEGAKKKLKETSFESFIRLLPLIFSLDWHLIPQYTSHEIEVTEGKFKVGYDRYFKVEDEEDKLFLRTELGINTEIKMNSTETTSQKIVWTPELRNIVNLLYRNDFLLFGYEIIQ